MHIAHRGLGRLAAAFSFRILFPTTPAFLLVTGLDMDRAQAPVEIFENHIAVDSSGVTSIKLG